MVLGMFGFANHLVLVECSYPTRSGCKEKNILIAHIYFSKRANTPLLLTMHSLLLGHKKRE